MSFTLEQRKQIKTCWHRQPDDIDDFIDEVEARLLIWNAMGIRKTESIAAAKKGKNAILTNLKKSMGELNKASHDSVRSLSPILYGTLEDAIAILERELTIDPPSGTGHHRRPERLLIGFVYGLWKHYYGEPAVYVDCTMERLMTILADILGLHTIGYQLIEKEIAEPTVTNPFEKTPT